MMTRQRLLCLIERRPSDRMLTTKSRLASLPRSLQGATCRCRCGRLPTTPHALPALSGDVVPLAHCRARARRTLLSLYAARTCRDPPTATSQAGGASRGGTSSGCANGATRATSSGRDTAGALDDGAGQMPAPPPGARRVAGASAAIDVDAPESDAPESDSPESVPQERGALPFDVRVKVSYTCPKGCGHEGGRVVDECAVRWTHSTHLPARAALPSRPTGSTDSPLACPLTAPPFR